MKQIIKDRKISHIAANLKIAAVVLFATLCVVSSKALYAQTDGSEGADDYVSVEDEEKAKAKAEKAAAKAAKSDAKEQESGEADDYTDADDASAAKQKQEKYPRKQGIFKFIYGNGRYIEADEFKVYTPNPVGSLALVPAKVIINPKNADAGIQVRFQASNYAVLFDEPTRHKIFKAVDRYLDDFANKRLKRKQRNSHSIYGRGKAYINYGTLAMMMAAEGKPDFQIGYKFKNKSPYFALTIRSTPNIDPYKAYNDVKDSVEVCIYFTKAQAQAFCSLLRDEIVQAAMLEEMEEMPGSGKTTKGDEYEE